MQQWGQILQQKTSSFQSSAFTEIDGHYATAIQSDILFLRDVIILEKDVAGMAFRGASMDFMNQ